MIILKTQFFKSHLLKLHFQTSLKSWGPFNHPILQAQPYLKFRDLQNPYHSPTRRGWSYHTIQYTLAQSLIIKDSRETFLKSKDWGRNSSSLAYVCKFVIGLFVFLLFVILSFVIVSFFIYLFVLVNWLFSFQFACKLQLAEFRN